jgi:hypothetical protein
MIRSSRKGFPFYLKSAFQIHHPVVTYTPLNVESNPSPQSLDDLQDKSPHPSMEYRHYPSFVVYFDQASHHPPYRLKDIFPRVLKL